MQHRCNGTRVWRRGLAKLCQTNHCELSDSGIRILQHDCDLRGVGAAAPPLLRAFGKLDQGAQSLPPDRRIWVLQFVSLPCLHLNWQLARVNTPEMQSQSADPHL